MKIALNKYFISADEIIDALRKLECQVDVFHGSDELKSIDLPDFVIDLNYHKDISQVCQARSIPLVIWSFDSGVTKNLPLSPPKSEYYFFFNHKDVDDAQRLTDQCWYLPFSAGDQFMHQPNANGTGILAIMNSYRDVLYKSENEFEKRVQALAGSEKQAFALAKQILEFAVERHQEIFCQNQFSVFINEMIEQCGADPFRLFPKSREMLLHSYRQILSSFQRERMVQSLAQCGSVSIYGDDYWSKLESPKISYYGNANYNSLADLYQNAAVNVNLTQIQGLESIPQRVFHVLASGGFLLTNEASCLAEIFTAGVHLDTFSTFEELQEKTCYYLAHPEKRLAIAQAGHQEFSTKHTMEHRLNFILEKMDHVLS